jgi:integrase
MYDLLVCGTCCVVVLRIGGVMASIEKRVAEDGKCVSYRVKIRLRGFPPESATFERKSDAKAWADRTEAEMKAGRYFGVSKRHRLSEVLDRYESSALLALKSANTVKARLDWWRKRLGDYLLSSVTPDLIAQKRDELRASPKQRGGGQRTAADVNRTLAALSSALSFAVKELGWLERNPMERVSKGAESPGRVRFLSDTELPALLAACKKSPSTDLYLAVVLALTTGGRKSETMGLRWAQIDFKQRTATLGDTKNGAARSLPLSGEVFVLLAERCKVRDLADDRLFPPHRGSRSPYIDLRDAFLTALKIAKIEDFHWHDLRHTAASYLMMEGTTHLEVAKVLGHSTLTMVLRYTHLSSTRVVQLGDLLANRFGVGNDQ